MSDGSKVLRVYVKPVLVRAAKLANVTALTPPASGGTRQFVEAMTRPQGFHARGGAISIEV